MTEREVWKQIDGMVDKAEAKYQVTDFEGPDERAGTLDRRWDYLMALLDEARPDEDAEEPREEVKAAAASPWEELREALLLVIPSGDDWWCPKCQEILGGSRVTYQERCDTCGTYLGYQTAEWVEKARSALRAIEGLKPPKREGVVYTEIKISSLHCWRCSGCDLTTVDADRPGLWHYCPHCGAPITEWRAWKDEEATT